MRYLEIMKKYRNERNWSQYNQKLKKIARIDFFISETAIEEWYYKGQRAQGGKIIYSDHVIELCLMMKEFYQLAYRQTQGFIGSVFENMNIELKIPDYTTLSRRAGKIKVKLRNKAIIKKSKEAIVVAIDSTGLSLYRQTEWQRRKRGVSKISGNDKWRKLHVMIDVKTGEILDNRYTKATINDGLMLPSLVKDIEESVESVCADMAYDTINCREAIRRKKARQLIPPSRNARVSKDNRNIKRQHYETLYERDEAIKYIRYNTINQDTSMARKSWKEKNGYHARSLVETTMWQIKSHTSAYLSNKKEQNRAVQAQIKCKIVNLIIAA